MGVLPELKGRDTSALRAIPCGGSAVPKALSEGYREQTGLPIMQAWGMTETSPIASVGRIKSTLDATLDDEGRADLRTTVGQPSIGVDAPHRRPGQHRGAAVGRRELGRAPGARARGSRREYYNDDRSPESFTEDGWLKTGDVAVIDRQGYIRLVDRTKDVIKSGGEWISSVDLENEIMGHPKVAEAAVIGVPHPKWAERPLACVVVKPGEELTKEEVLAFLDGQGGQVVAARRRRLHRRGPQDQRRQVLQEGPARQVRGLRAARPPEAPHRLYPRSGELAVRPPTQVDRPPRGGGASSW